MKKLVLIALSTGLLCGTIVVLSNAGPIRNTQSVTLIEKWPGKEQTYTQRLVYIDRASDARAIVCLKVHVANEKDHSITCFYGMNKGNEVLAIQAAVIGEDTT